LKTGQHLLKKGFYVVLFKGTGILVSYVFTLYITNFFGAKAFGQYSIYFAIVNILSVIALFGTDRSIIKLFNQKSYIEGNSNVIHSLIAVCFTSAIFSALLYFNWDYLVAKFFTSSPSIAQLKRYSFILFFYSLYIFFSEAIRAKNKMGLYGLLRFNMVFLFALVFLYFFDQSGIEWAPIKSFIYSGLIVSLISFLLFQREFKWKLNFNRDVLKRILYVSYPMLLASSMGLIVGWIDTFMLSYFIDEKSVGIYNVAFKVAFFSSILLTTINTVISPKIAKLSSENKHSEIKILMRKVSKILFIGATLIFLISIFNMELILSFFGSEFTEGIATLAILLVGQFISSYSGPVAILLQMTGYEKIFMYISIVAMVVNVGLNLLLIPELGYFGAAIASAFTLIFNNLCCVFFVKKRLGFYSIFIPFRKNA